MRTKDKRKRYSHWKMLKIQKTGNTHIFLFFLLSKIKLNIYSPQKSLPLSPRWSYSRPSLSLPAKVTDAHVGILTMLLNLRRLVPFWTFSVAFSVRFPVVFAFEFHLPFLTWFLFFIFFLYFSHIFYNSIRSPWNFVCAFQSHLLLWTGIRFSVEREETGNCQIDKERKGSN